MMPLNIQSVDLHTLSYTNSCIFSFKFRILLLWFQQSISKCCLNFHLVNGTIMESALDLPSQRQARLSPQ